MQRNIYRNDWNFGKFFKLMLAVMLLLILKNQYELFSYEINYEKKYILQMAQTCQPSCQCHYQHE